MKTRSFVLLIIVAAVLVLLMLWHGNKKPEEIQPMASVKTNDEAVTIPRHLTSMSASPLASQTSLTQNIATVAQQDKGEQIKEGLTKLNDVPIAFYGIVEDQFGNPVGGAQIAASVRIYNAVQSTVERFFTVSDANGFFQISHGSGESLSVVPSKKGYVLAMTNISFNYSYMYLDHFSPDPNNPKVLKMWKLQGAESLVDISKEYKLEFTGTPIYFDLLAGKIVPTGGDLEAVIRRAPGSLSKKEPADWSINLRPINGGIIESEYHAAQFTFEAPADGYQGDYLVQMKQDDPAWYDNLHDTFFLKSRGGQVYAKFNFDFMINLEPNGLIHFRFKGVANTNSSRNWEATTPQ